MKVFSRRMAGGRGLIVVFMAVVVIAAWRFNWQAREISLATAVGAIGYLLWQIRQGNGESRLDQGNNDGLISQVNSRDNQLGNLKQLPGPMPTDEERRRWLDEFLVRQQEDVK